MSESGLVSVGLLGAAEAHPGCPSCYVDCHKHGIAATGGLCRCCAVKQAFQVGACRCAPAQPLAALRLAA